MPHSQANPIYKEGTNGAAVLLLHGFTGTPYLMHPLAESLHQNKFTVDAPLLSGHGDSNETLKKSEWPHWYETAQQHYLALRQSHQKVCVAGLSMGGLLTLKLAEDYPEEITAISCLATPLFLSTWVNIAVRLVWHSPLRYLYRYEKKKDGGDIKNETLKPQIWSNDAMPVSCIHSLMNLQQLTLQNLKKVSAPTLVIHAREDHTAPYENLRAIAQGVNSKTVQTLTLHNSYHLITLDFDRDLVTRTVTDFFNTAAK